MTTINAKIERALARKMRQVAHLSPAEQAAYRVRQERVLREQAMINHEREFEIGRAHV